MRTSHRTIWNLRFAYLHLSKAAMRWYSLKVLADMLSMIALDSLGGSMASITIRNLDDDLKAKLRVLAASHGRSMEEEARIIIRQALSRQEKRGGLGTRIHSRFASVGGVDLALPERKDKARAASFDE